MEGQTQARVVMEKPKPIWSIIIAVAIIVSAILIMAAIAFKPSDGGVCGSYNLSCPEPSVTISQPDIYVNGSGGCDISCPQQVCSPTFEFVCGNDTYTNCTYIINTTSITNVSYDCWAKNLNTTLTYWDGNGSLVFNVTMPFMGNGSYLSTNTTSNETWEVKIQK